MRAHIIENGIVINTVEVDSVELARQLFPESICIEATEGGSGWKYENGVLTAPPEPPVPPVPVPRVVSMRQARLALLGADLLDTVDAAIAQAGGAAKIEWEYSTEIRRDAALTVAMQSVLGMTDEQINNLFIEAAKL